MIRVIAIDDEPLALRLMEMYIGKMPQLELVGSCLSVAAARPLLDRADAIFIDINMPDVSGMEFVRSLPEGNAPLVVFTTAYAEYAVEGFKVDAVDYLLKPFNFEEFSRAVAKLEQRLKLLKAASGKPSGEDALYFKADYKTVRVPLSDFICAESMGAYVKIWIEGREMPLIVFYTLRRLESELPPERFMRIHKSHIVALDRIGSASKTAVTLKGGRSIPVGEAFRAAFTARYPVKVNG